MYKTVFNKSKLILKRGVYFQSMIENPYKNNTVLEYLEEELVKVGSSVHDVVPWLMKAPLITTFRINTLTTAIEDVKNHFEKDLKQQERCSVTIPKIKQIPDIDDVLVIESWENQGDRECEVCGMDCKASEIIVDAMCGAAVLRGAHVFAPGVLAMAKGTRRGQKVKIFADLEGRCLQGLAIKYEGRKQYIGHGTVEMERCELFGTEEPPRGIAIKITSNPSGCPSLSTLPHMGLLQNLPSIFTCLELDPKPGQTVIDMCAAPGNKTSHIAALMRNQGVLVALDRTSKKAQQVRDTCQQLSAHCYVFAWDSTRAVASSAEIEQDVLLGPPFKPCSFDKILLDAPCSALGQRPQLLNKTSLSQLKSYPSLQQKLFRQAVALARPGGEIVYSTCTMTSCENEDLVAWALKHYGTDITLLPPNKRMTPIVPSSTPDAYDLPIDISSCVQRFGPPILGKEDQYIDSVGFFIAKFRKNC